MISNKLMGAGGGGTKRWVENRQAKEKKRPKKKQNQKKNVAPSTDIFFFLSLSLSLLLFLSLSLSRFPRLSVCTRACVLFFFYLN